MRHSGPGRKKQVPQRRRIGIFGGTFDPPHRGHLAVARAAVTQLDLDRVYFVPARVAPHKQGLRTTAAVHRAAMLRLAIRAHPAYRLSLWELRRNRVSFTIDTLRMFRRRFPKAEFVLLIGEDNLQTFEQWKSPRLIRRLAALAVYPRRPAGSRIRVPKNTPESVRLTGTFVNVSSTAIREDVRHSRRPTQVPGTVATYIRRHRLYARDGQRTARS